MKLFTNPLVWLQKFVATNQKAVIRFSYLLMITLIGLVVTTYLVKDYRVYWSELGKKAATLSLILFWVTLIPGILKRFQLTGIFMPIRVIIMLFRKEIGILMFLLAFAHYFWSRFLPILVIKGDLLAFSLFEIFGLGALVLAFPMFITSNDLSIQKLGKVWKLIHSATYIIIWLLFLHVVLRNPDIKALITLILGCLTLASLAKEKTS
ncbi:MAG: ferric reductase-like transmembrane domain-containing protein [Patescibacteria group bacterium]